MSVDDGYEEPRWVVKHPRGFVCLDSYGLRLSVRKRDATEFPSAQTAVDEITIVLNELSPSKRVRWREPLQVLRIAEGGKDV